ncbi:MAG: M3 family metallopeptidase [bacterium]
MKHFLLLVLITLISLSTNRAQEKVVDNPFFKEWKTPFKTIPFNDIKPEHYLPAYEEGIKQQNAEIKAIVDNSEKPTFKNTIEALEKSGQLLTTVKKVFNQMNAVNTNDEIQKIAEKTTALASKQTDDIFLNDKLFERIKSVYNEKDKLNLTAEQQRLLNFYYLDFVRGGANLNEKDKTELRRINSELAQLVLKFGDNVRFENNKFELVVDKKEDLAGLPDASIQAAADKAKAKGLTGKWIFTIDKPTLIPFLQYSANRGLREKMYKAYMNRGNNNDEFDNKEIFSKIISLRVQKANLLGYKTYADFVLEKKMAKTADAVYNFLNDIWKPTLEKSKSEVADMQKIIDKENGNFKLAPWDWWYYAEKVKKEKYDLDEEMIRPYFKLENVLQGAFDVAGKLFGIKFVERNDIQIYNTNVKVFEVFESDGKHVGILYTDYFPRSNKTNGAWCGGFRDQSNVDGNFITPLIYNCGNFTMPTADKPALISLDEVLTLFHEFGHGLHALFQNVNYPGSGNVFSDFVELPSQIMENWATQPEVLKMYAKHYKTDEPIPQELIDKISKSSKFNQGFETLEYIAASLLDMDWHTVNQTTPIDVPTFEKESIKKMGIIPEILPRYLTTNFIHIATWEYEAAYYSYLWSAVLDSDAFEFFMEKGLFNKGLADSYRKNILEKAGSEDPMELYKRFRGREPKVDALLEKRGLK